MMAKIEWYEEILALEPGSKVFFPFAKRLAEDGLHDKALSVLRHGLVQHPEYLEARVFLTHLLYAIGDTESALKEAQTVFARLAPYPAFWEALSLANEAVPGDMSLAMRFMAEALRAPGLTFAATLRRGLVPQTATALAEPSVNGAEAQETAPCEAVSEAEFTEEVAEASPDAVADSAVVDPLEPVAEDENEPAESVCACSVLAESLLPLDDGDLPTLPGAEVAEEPDALLPVENVETVLADAASVDEALAELDGALSGMAAEATESLAPLSVEDLAELDETLFGETESVAEIGTEDVALPSLEELSELAELAAQDDASLLAADAEDALPSDADSEAASDPVGLADEEDAAPAEAAPAPTADPAPSFFLDGGLLDLSDPDDDESEVAGFSESGTDSEEMASEQAVSRTETPASDVSVADDDEVSDLDAVVEAEDEELELSSEALFLMKSVLEAAEDSAVAESEGVSQAEDVLEAEALAEGLSQAGAEPMTPEVSGAFASAVHVHIQPVNVAEDDAPVAAATPFQAAESAGESDNADADMADDLPVRTRSMADVLAEQGDIDGALAIYDELLHHAAPDEAASLVERMEMLRGQKAVEKPEAKPARADKAGLRSMLENLAGRLEKRAKS